MAGKNGKQKRQAKMAHHVKDEFSIVLSSKIIQTNIHEMIQIFNICLSC